MQGHELAHKFKTYADVLELSDLWNEIFSGPQPGSLQQIKDDIERFKQAAAKSQKALARKHHPDLGGSLETMQRINEAWNFVKQLQVIEAPPPQPVFVNINFGFDSAESTSASAHWGTRSWVKVTRW